MLEPNFEKADGLGIRDDTFVKKEKVKMICLKNRETNGCHTY